MRKVIASVFVTLDGFMSGPNGELDWSITDEAKEKDTDDLLSTVDAILLGRATYQILSNFWPFAPLDDDIIADKMNSIPKIIFSKTLEKAEWGKWNNATLVKDNIAEEVANLKQQPGKDMVIFGSGKIVSTLTNLGLIDEYRMIVNPVVLGSGKPLFSGIVKPANLKLLRTKTYKNGVVVLYYEPAKQNEKQLGLTQNAF